MPIIINGGSRSAGGWWAKHLENGEKNERVEVIEVVGLSAATIPDAFREMEGISLGSKCQNYFYQANINPRADETLTPAQWREAVDTLENNLGLTGQPRFVVEHEKEGRTHRHVVWSRVDPERMTAISDSLTAAIHERTSRALEIKFDLERGQSILVPDRKTARPDRRPQKHETFRAEESGIDPEKVKADIRQHWRSADNGQSFKAALEASGDYVLARGDRRDFVVIDRAGDDHSLARRLGVKAAEMRTRMADLDPAGLPNVQEAKAQQQARHVERENQPGTEIDHAAELSMQEARAAAKGRIDDVRPEPNGERPYQRDDTAPSPATREHAEEGIPTYRAPAENAPEATATRPIVAPEPETAKSAEIEPALSEHEIRSIGSILGGILEGVTKPFENLISALADMFSAPPPMTQDQAERAARAAEENREANAAQAAQQERADELDRIIAELDKQRQQEEDFAARYGTPGGSSGRDRDDDYDRGRERER